MRHRIVILSATLSVLVTSALPSHAAAEDPSQPMDEIESFVDRPLRRVSYRQ